MPLEPRPKPTPDEDKPGRYQLTLHDWAFVDPRDWPYDPKARKEISDAEIDSLEAREVLRRVNYRKL